MNASCTDSLRQISSWVSEQTNEQSNVINAYSTLPALLPPSVLPRSFLYHSAPLFCQHLDLLLSQICGIVEKHTEVTVLEACAHLASILCSDCYTFSSRAHLAFSQLLDGLTECFSTYLSDLLQVGERVSEACTQPNMVRNTSQYNAVQFNNTTNCSFQKGRIHCETVAWDCIRFSQVCLIIKCILV